MYCLFPAITCPVPRTIDNGGYTATSLNAGSTATFYCDTGYHLSSDSVLTCLQNGRWDKPLPECVGKLVRIRRRSYFQIKR